MLRKIRSYVEKWHMIEKNDRVVVGVSGGADSVCLLLVLKQLQKELGFYLHAVHVNHCLRGEDADADERYVRALCKRYEVPCEFCREDVAWIAKMRKQSLEEAGREVRRERFERVCGQIGGTKIALAHHSNDNAETFLMNLVRGSGLKGLGGMVPVNGMYIRPLLVVTREEIESYLREQGISFCVDASNMSDAYTRNRVRNHVIPYLEEQVNAKAVSHICEAMEQLRGVQQYLADETSRCYEKCVERSNEQAVIMEQPFSEVADTLRPFLIQKVLKEVSGREKDLESVHMKLVEELFSKQVGRTLHLPYGMEAKRVYGGVVCRIQTEQQEKTLGEEQILDFTKATAGSCVWGEVRIHYRVLDAKNLPLNNGEKDYTKWFDYDIIKDTVIVRGRRAGDFITIHEDGKRQKLKSFFVNEKIPQEERDHIPLITVGSHVLWIVGYRVSEAYRVREHTKQILEIQIDEGEHYGREN